MLNAAHDLHLAPNPHQIGVGGDLALFDRLDGHLLSRLLVDAQLHLAVRALPQFLDDVEALAQLLAMVVHAHRAGVADAAHDVVDGGGLRQRRRHRRLLHGGRLLLVTASSYHHYGAALALAAAQNGRREGRRVW